jgi:mono/diheme cytochrome c family protein
MSDHSKETHAGEAKLYGLLAEIEGPEALVEAARRVRDAGYSKWDCYSPFPVHGIDPAMGIKRTILPVIVFVVGLTGAGLALLLQWWTNAHDWPWIVSGKPYFSLPANIPITFEGTILFSVFAAFLGMWALNKLPQVWHPLFRSDRFLKVTDDGFFIGIEAADDKFSLADTRALLEAAGAVVVEKVYLDPDPVKKQIPKPVIGFIVVTTILALVPFALIAKARASHSSKPHWHVFAGMDFQAKVKSQTASDIFYDGRSSRPPVDGTVARGHLKADDHFYRGLLNDEWATTFPPDLEISARTVERGRERYEIFCATCHGTSGYGNGMIAERARTVPNAGWVPPTSIHLENVVRQPHGQLFNTIGNGIRNMPGYGAQIGEADRWAIVLYIRALQRSQAATIDDVPPEKRREIR